VHYTVPMHIKEPEEHPHERDLAAWWAAGGAVGRDLVAADGRTARVVYAGRRGGPSGPDFRDAVIAIGGERCVGDVELHLRASGWRDHGHDRDARYNRVIAHVVAGGSAPADGTSPLQSGGAAPVIVLGGGTCPEPGIGLPAWPCQEHPLPQADLVAWLRAAGRARFEERVARAAMPASLGAILARMVAEAAGYGHDPGAMREALASGDVAALDRLSVRRAIALVRAGVADSEWLAMRCCGAALAGGAECGWQRLIDLFAPAVGGPRAAIIVWNAVLPCLAAYADRNGSVALGRAARAIACAAPGLPANAITRAMGRWLGLRRAPEGALAQQGLHHLHARWCRTKTCSACPLRSGAAPSQ
jgi:hypothetical protein